MCSIKTLIYCLSALKLIFGNSQNEILNSLSHHVQDHIFDK